MWNIKRHREGDLTPWLIHGCIVYGPDLCLLNYLRWRTIFLPIHPELVYGPTEHDSYSAHVTRNSSPLSQHSHWSQPRSMSQDHWSHSCFQCVYLGQTTDKKEVHRLITLLRVWDLESHSPASVWAPLLMCMTGAISFISLCLSFICEMVTNTDLIS